jgi:hypothetical protein
LINNVINYKYSCKCTIIIIDYKKIGALMKSSDNEYEDLEFDFRGKEGLARLITCINADAYLEKKLQNEIKGLPVVGITARPLKDNEDDSVSIPIDPDTLADENIAFLLSDENIAFLLSKVQKALDQYNLQYRVIATRFMALAITSLIVGLLVITSPVMLPFTGAIVMLAVSGIALGTIGFTKAIMSKKTFDDTIIEKPVAKNEPDVLNSVSSSPLHSDGLSPKLSDNTAPIILEPSHDSMANPNTNTRK